MKNILPFAILATFVLSSCGGSSQASSVTRDQLLRNPLFAEQYYDDLGDQMVNLFIQNDPVTTGPKKELIEQTRVDSPNAAREANSLQRQGRMGNFVSDKATVLGEVLLLNDRLYTGPDFVGSPGRNLQVILSKLSDPREGTFPDPDSVNLGALISPYGSQEIDVPTLQNPGTYLSVVLWDKDLELMYAFAQLH